MIKNTMCRLADLTQEQIDSLVDAMPESVYLERSWQPADALGFDKKGNSGFWILLLDSTIVTYTEMMQLLGVDMKKATAQEQMKILQAEMDKMQAIIDKADVKTGRVMHVDDLGDFYYKLCGNCKAERVGVMFHTAVQLINLVSMGLIFHDEQSCSVAIEFLKRDQALRIVNPVMTF